MILHGERRPYRWQQMINDAVRNIHLPKRPAALLRCYAGHAQYFKPSLKVVARESGIAENKVSEIRQVLVQFGLIDYKKSTDHKPGHVYIDWERIRAYARLDTPLPRPYDRSSFRPVNLKKAMPQSKTIRQILKESKGITFGCMTDLFSPPDRTNLTDDKNTDFFVAVAENMTEEEYALIAETLYRTSQEKIREGKPVYEPIPFPDSIPDIIEPDKAAMDTLYPDHRYC